jgi:hypothetical protein
MLNKSFCFDEFGFGNIVIYLSVSEAIDLCPVLCQCPLDYILHGRSEDNDPVGLMNSVDGYGLRVITLTHLSCKFFFEIVF